jgi:exodeoxyribonuclease-3
LLLNEELAPLLADANVDREVRGRPGASDHAPVWIELELPF